MKMNSVRDRVTMLVRTRPGRQGIRARTAHMLEKSWSCIGQGCGGRALVLTWHNRPALGSLQVPSQRLSSWLRHGHGSRGLILAQHSCPRLGQCSCSSKHGRVMHGACPWGISFLCRLRRTAPGATLGLVHMQCRNGAHACARAHAGHGSQHSVMALILMIMRPLGLSKSLVRTGCGQLLSARANKLPSTASSTSH